MPTDVISQVIKFKFVQLILMTQDRVGSIHQQWGYDCILRFFFLGL